MNEPAVQPQQPTQNPVSANPNIPPTVIPNAQEEINKLLAAVEKFRKTGFVEESEVTFAKEKILPQLDYSTEQINDLGPVGIMVKLQEEADKKRIGADGVNQTNGTKPTETKPEETPGNKSPELQAEKPAAVPEAKIETIANSGNFDQVTKQVAQITDKLSSDIDREIKRQLEEKKALEQAQEKVDHVLKEHEEISLPEVNKEAENEKPKIGLFNKAAENKEGSLPPIIHEVAYRPGQPPEPLPQETLSTDPLAASVDLALNSLKEGDSIGSEWNLQKILTTSFGNKKSPFYELINKSGASWTLSPEEMKNVIRSNILSKNNTPVKEIKGEKPTETKDHEPEIKFAEVKKEAHKDSLESKMHPAEEERNEVKVEKHDQEEREYQKVSFQKPEKNHEKSPENKPTFKHHKEETKPEFKEKEQTFEKAEAKSESPTPTRFNQKQVDFLNKIHADQNLWNTFTSFNPELWESFHNLYEDGKLISIGIDAHPLFDKLSSNEYGNMIDIQKGDTASKLLSEAGYNLSWSKDDAEIFAVHIIANHKLLTDSAHKVEVSGLASPVLPSEKDVIELTIGAKNGNNESMHKLEEALNFLPIGSRFKLIKQLQLDQLRKYFKR